MKSDLDSLDGCAIDDTSVVGGDPNLLEPRLHHKKNERPAMPVVHYESRGNNR